MTNEIETLLNEIRLIYQKLVEVGDRIHADEKVSMGMRAVLEILLKNGPATVPDIARSRSVTRQHIQVLANELLNRDLVELAINPSHKRSSLLTLTSEGEDLIQRMRRREFRLYEETGFGVTTEELISAATTLETIRRALGDIRH
jgi:DNA-binding MarR family transcriptional regulator